MGKQDHLKPLAFIIKASIALAILGTLGVSIAILVTVINNKNSNVVVNDQPNPLNVKPNSQISSSDSRYSAFQSVVQLFKGKVDTTIDPCSDFYRYTCGANFDGPMSFDISDNDNFMKIAQQMSDTSYYSSAPKSVKQTISYWKRCIDARHNWNKQVADGKQVSDAINRLGQGFYHPGLPNNTGSYPFPMLNQSANVTDWPNNFGLGYLIGELNGVEGVPNILTTYVDTNWKDPSGNNGFAFFIDQPTTIYPNTYYRKDWDKIKPTLWNRINSTMNLLAQVKKVTLKQDVLKKDIDDLVQFEYYLAINFSIDDNTRRQYNRNYNPMLIDDLYANNSAISWHTLIPYAVGPANSTMFTILNPSTNYNFYILMEPMVLNMLTSNFVNKNQFGITPRTLINYFYYRLVDANRDYLPWPTDSADAQGVRIALQQKGRPKHIMPEEQKWRRRQMDDIDDASIDCVVETMELLMYTNARVFIDKIYPTNESRVAVREHVGQIASAIVVAFRSMIDQLSWMTMATKKAAYAKMDNLVKNIAYPDFIADDKQLDAYHSMLTFRENDSYFAMVSNTYNFNYFVMWNQLIQGAADRTGFNGPPSTTNAWYQPELNSITFPAAILRQPFYDPSWPNAMIFGAMGIIAGHELTHGFDDEGVQWDSIGALSGWMDDSSRTNFSMMAQCVIDEYNGFCPLDKNTYGTAACLDGQETQGENIADNGGMHAAWRAYHNFQALYGPDPALPDDTLQHFTGDQLFFLSFAQVWCQTKPSDDQFLRQILVDVHSPSIYRVLGSIQNFPSFRTAFGCQPGSTYAPTKHCDVWVSDINTQIGLPAVKSDTNVRDTPQITSGNVDKFNAYKIASDYFTASVNTSFDPCDDFFSYACGSFNQEVSFYAARAANLYHMADQLQLPSYQPTIKNSTALTKEKTFFDSCVQISNTTGAINGTLVQKKYIDNLVTKLSDNLGQPFTAVLGGTAGRPSSTQLAKALGFLSFTQGIDTLVTPMVDTNWDNPTSGYKLFIDQNTAYFYAKTYYKPDAWKITRPGYIETCVEVLGNYTVEQGKVFNRGDTTKLVETIVDFEQYLAYNLSTDDDTRRQFKRSWNLMDVNQLTTKYSFIDWPAYFNMVPDVARSIVTDKTYQVSVMEVDMISKLNVAYNDGTVNMNTLVNYLYLRLLLGSTEYIPSYSAAFSHLLEDDSIHLGLSRSRPRLSRARPLHPSRLSSLRPRTATSTPIQAGCAGQANSLLQYANGRVFIDYMYPDQASIKNIRILVGGIVGNIISSFQGMLDTLDWMDPPTRTEAYKKTVDIVKNIAFPDWIKNDTTLDEYHKTLQFAGDTYFDMLQKLTTFNIYIQYKQLTESTYDRHDFLSQPGTVNAWYQPELNSITFPAGILVPPYFHPLWPSSINYGAMGVVSGHELTHGFDDGGVQWNSIGKLESWMDPSTTIGFKNMSQCVIDEYSLFCPLPGNYTPNDCVNGVQTQGENIADNGGIHAAYNAYRTHLALDGLEPLLPDRLGGQWTHDQLFFLSFAQVWCQAPSTDAAMYKQLMVDPHSPSVYRVMGTVKNFPAFQQAFNCPSNSKMTPSDHCRVWSPNVYP